MKLTISLIIYWGMVFLPPGTFLINTVVSSSFFKVVYLTTAYRSYPSLQCLVTMLASLILM